MITLMNAVVRSCVSAGRVAVPAEQAGPTAELLTRLVVDPWLRDEYRAAVAAARAAAERDRPGADRLFASERAADVPGREVARRGFGLLTAEQLAGYATSPDALEALAEWLREIEPIDDLGDWYMDAAGRARRERPTDPERERRRRAFVGALIGPPSPRPPDDDDSPGAPHPDPTSATGEEELPTPRLLLRRLVELKLIPPLTGPGEDAWAAVCGGAITRRAPETLTRETCARRFGTTEEIAGGVLESLVRVGVLTPTAGGFTVPPFDQQAFQKALLERSGREIAAAMKRQNRVGVDYSEARRHNALLERWSEHPGAAGQIAFRILDCLLHIELMVLADETDGVFDVLKAFFRMNINETAEHRPQVVREHTRILESLVKGEAPGVVPGVVLAYLDHFHLAERRFRGADGGVVVLGGGQPAAAWEEISDLFRSLGDGLYLFRAFNATPLEFSMSGWERLKDGIASAVRSGATLCYFVGSRAAVRRWAASAEIRPSEYDTLHDRLEAGLTWFLGVLAQETGRTPDELERQVRRIYFDSESGLYRIPNETYALYLTAGGGKKLTRRLEYAASVAAPDILVLPAVDSSTRTFVVEMRAELERLPEDAAAREVRVVLERFINNKNVTPVGINSDDRRDE